MTILEIVLLVLGVILYFFIGAIVACMVTDVYDDGGAKFVLALFWPIVLIVFGIFIIEDLPFVKLPRKIANAIKKKIHKEDE